MRILIDTKLLGKGGTTGVSGYTREMVEALLTYSEHEYRLFYNGLHMNPLPQEWLSNPRISVLNWHIPNKIFHLTTRLFNWPSLDSQKDIDLIFSPHFHLLASKKIPRIITFHDLSFIHYPQFFSPKQRLWHWWQQYAKQARAASHIIAVSKFTKSDLVRILQIPQEKITVMYSGVGTEFKKIPPTDPKLAHYKLMNQLTKPFFLFLGTLEPRKNIPTLIKAFSLLKNNPHFKEYQLVIAGRPGYKASGIYKTARESPARGDIRFLPNVSDLERPLLYNCARVFVFPSWFEGFGFPPLEAQACAVPVIAADRTSVPEILGSCALYANPWKPTEFAEQLMKLETDSALRQRLISAGITNAKRFTWEKAARQMTEIFQSS